MNIRKGSLVSVNEFALGLLRQYIGQHFKVEKIVKRNTKTYARIGGVLVPVMVLNYAGPQKKAGSTVRVKAR
jgi:hypothetical protein